MIDFIIDRLVCAGCLGLKFGPGHLVWKFILGIDCNRSQ